MTQNETTVRPKGGHSRTQMLLIAALVGWLGAACSVEVQMKHEPIVATLSEQITFTAEADPGITPDSMEIQMFVDGSLVKTCTSTPCTYTGGPYASHENGWLGYHAETTADFDFLGIESTASDSDLGYTGITESDYSWKDSLGATWIPARWGGHSTVTTNVLFQRSTDYNSVSIANGRADFLSDLSTKIHDILMDKEEIWGHMDDINIYAYRWAGDTSSGCPGTLHGDTTSDTGSFVDDNGLLHVTTFQDCTTGFNQFTAEGSTTTQAFLHEFSHSIFELADEYDGPTFYFEAANEPNIFSTESNCQTEQTDKGRDPSACYQFTSLSGGWWGIHTGTTVMTNGLESHPWSVESVERLQWWFDNN